MTTDPAARPGRAHTGRRRNEAAREAILDAALLLLGRGEPVTVETIAAAAGVGKQTIYRWWPSKYAVLLEAMTERARMDVPRPDTGSLAGDLAAFLRATFEGAARTSTAAFLRVVAAEAQADPNAAKLAREFTGRRREALRALLGRWRAEGELDPDVDLDLIVDQAFGLLWYRLLFGHGGLDARAAGELAAGLVRQATRRGEDPTSG